MIATSTKLRGRKPSLGRQKALNARNRPWVWKEVDEILGLDHTAIAEPISDPMSVPPVLVGEDGYLVDGHHRVAGVIAARGTKIRAYIGHMPAPTRNARIGDLDPTRTFTLRRSFAQKIKKKFSTIKARIIKLVEKEDALGLKARNPLLGNVLNDDFFQTCERDKTGHCIAGTGGTATGEASDRGTKDNPIHVGSDIKRAAILLAQGKHIQLNQPEQISTLIDRMSKLVKQAVRLGDKAPNFDLCKVSVPGTNLFCQDNLGIPRVNMPQLRGMPVPGTYAATLKPNKKGKVDLTRDFISHLHDQGIGVKTTSVPASHLRASQNQIVGTRVAELVNEAMAGTRDLREKPIFVTKDNYVLDGHHHWAAIVGYGYGKQKDLKVPVYKLDMDIGKAISMANEFTKKKGLASKAATANRRWIKKYILGNLRFQETKFKNIEGSYTLLVDNNRWQFATDPEKVRAFRAWLQAQIDDELLDIDEEELWRAYTIQGFQKGAARAFDDVEKPYALGYAEEPPDVRDFYAGSKEQFLRDTFYQPVAVEKVKLLAERTFMDLKAVTADMSVRIGRSLMDGLVQGKSPIEIARALAEAVDFSRERALLVARTEIIRAHAEGQLVGLRNLGVEDVGVAVEWSITKHRDGSIESKVCDQCRPMQGVILSLDEAEGLIPRHPNCRCSWIPANVGERGRGQKKTKKKVTQAIDESVEAEGGDEESDWIGADLDIAAKRPKSILGNSRGVSLNADDPIVIMENALNAFCPTGPGGGVDPTCSPSGEGGKKYKGEYSGAMDNTSLKQGIEKIAGVKLRISTYKRKQDPAEAYVEVFATDTESFVHKGKTYYRGKSLDEYTIYGAKTTREAAHKALLKAAEGLGVKIKDTEAMKRAEQHEWEARMRERKDKDVENADFFASCERDRLGHCVAGAGEAEGGKERPIELPPQNEHPDAKHCREAWADIMEKTLESRHEAVRAEAHLKETHAHLRQTVRHFNTMVYDEPMAKHVLDMPVGPERVKAAHDFRAALEEKHRPARDEARKNFDDAKKAYDTARGIARADMLYELKRSKPKDLIPPIIDTTIGFNHKTAGFPKLKAQMEGAKQFLEDQMGSKLRQSYEVRYERLPARKKRVWCDSPTPDKSIIKLNIHNGTDTNVHEWGHALEGQNSEIFQAAKDFLARRVGNETPLRMRDVTGNKNYKPWEYGRKDFFDKLFTDVGLAYYVGKDYKHKLGHPQAGQIYATEITSMGLQTLYDDPVRLFEKDPDYAQYIIGILHHRYKRHATSPT
jgi:SPP1 gp7 family putative phage head morphogenesis protein